MEELQKEISDLKHQLTEKNSRIEMLENRLLAYERVECIKVQDCSEPSLPEMDKEPELNNKDIAKFSRQIILPEFRVKSQKKLKGSSVLIVGCGGLGCPAGVYLAGAGVGRIGLVDHDTVEISNLHRQILHTETRVGELKCVSAAKSLAALNPDTEYVPIHTALTSINALEIIKQFDIVLDCTDNVPTRYLLNDACVMLNKCLVSGSALRWEGQLTVYNLAGGPTYRCMYPTPPPAEAVTNCSDGGVIGAVPGLIGVLQALETIKILTQGVSSLSGKLLLVDALEGTFRSVKLRNRTEKGGDITKLVDYELFCGSKATDKDSRLKLLDDGMRISVKELNRMREEGSDHILVDVRSDTEFEMGNIPGSVNIPIHEFQAEASLSRHFPSFGSNKIICICRRGNDSQIACAALNQYWRREEGEKEIKDVIGGLHAWARSIDSTFPVY